MSVLIKAPAKAELTFIIDGGGTPIDTGQKGHSGSPSPASLTVPP